MPDIVDHRSPEWSPTFQFFAAYLNQDMDLEYERPWDAVADFRSEATAGRRTEVAEGIRRLVAVFDDDRELGAAAGSLGMAYHPPGDGYAGYRTWLSAVADYLENPDLDREPMRDAPGPEPS